jgi:RNA polymerase sigma-70 factor (ECF subfamily)
VGKTSKGVEVERRHRTGIGLLAGAALRAQPDQRLVRLVREGYPQAFGELVRRYRGALVAYAGTIVPRHRAEDVVQESCARAFRAMTESDQELKVRAWFYAIVRNAALNDLRDERRHESLADEHEGAVEPPEVIARRERMDAIVSELSAALDEVALAGLPPEDGD